MIYMWQIAYGGSILENIIANAPSIHTVYCHCRDFFVYLQRHTCEHIHVSSLTFCIFLFSFLLCPCIYIKVELFICYNVYFLFLFLGDMIPCNISSYQTHFAIKDYIDFLILVPLIWNTEITGVYFLMMLYIFFKYQDMF